MNQVEVVERYFEAWNSHDAAMLVSLFSPNGSYCDTSMNRALRGSAIATHAMSLWNAFPDFYFSRRATMTDNEGDVAAQWILRGTHEGSLMGLPPAGYTISLPGLDVTAVEGELIRSVRSYFDMRNLFEQLGMEVIVQPRPAPLPPSLGDEYVMRLIELGRVSV